MFSKQEQPGQPMGIFGGNAGVSYDSRSTTYYDEQNPPEVPMFKDEPVFLLEELLSKLDYRSSENLYFGDELEQDWERGLNLRSLNNDDTSTGPEPKLIPARTLGEYKLLFDIFRSSDQKSFVTPSGYSSLRSTLTKVFDDTLNENEKKVLRFKYGLGNVSPNPSTIGVARKMSISQKAVSEILDTAIRKLRAPSNTKVLNEFLSPLQ